MNHFISNILGRHSGDFDPVMPRLPGRFESDALNATAPAPERISPFPAPDPRPVDQIQAVSQPAPVFDSLFTPPLVLQMPRSGERQAVSDPVSIPTERRPAIQQPENPAAPIPARSVENHFHDDRQSTTVLMETSVFNNVEQLFRTDAAPAPTPTPEVLPQNFRSAVETAIAPRDSQPQHSHGSLGVPPGSMQAFPVPLQLPQADAPPVIRVSIGQVYVKAAGSPTANAARSVPSQPRKPALSLDDYLKKRG